MDVLLLPHACATHGVFHGPKRLNVDCRSCGLCAERSEAANADHVFHGARACE